MLRFTRRDREPEPVFDRRGYYRSPVTLPSYRQGKPAPNKGRKFPAEPLTMRELDAILRQCGKGPAGRRNAALIVVMARGGLRVSEALALRSKDLDLERGRVAVLHGKGDKARVVALDPGACALVERWARERKRIGLTGSSPFFCVISAPTKGQPINSTYVRELLKKLAAKAGIDKRVHPHGLRHTYASFLMDAGVPIHYIQVALGHTDIRVTHRYVSHLNPAQVLEYLREVPWPELAARRRTEATRRAA
jgi:site-specific recombinase XerD